MKSIRQISLVLVILAAWVHSSIWSLADDTIDLNRTLTKRMSVVIVAVPLEAEGRGADQQFYDVLQKISNLYAERWNRPLPIRIEFEALQRLRSSAKDLTAFLGGNLLDVPLIETLRDWCSRADLTFTIDHGTVLIVAEQKQTNGGISK